MLRLFQSRRKTIKSPRILLGVVGKNRSAIALLAQDRTIYKRYAGGLSEHHCDTPSDLLRITQVESFDIVHLFMTLSTDGTVEGEPVLPLLTHLSETGTRLFILASENSMDAYTEALPRNRAKSLRAANVILTLERRGDKFSGFFSDLFGLMADGKSMAMAWVELVPQAAGPWQENVPSTLFEAGEPHIRFIPSPSEIQ